MSVGLYFDVHVDHAIAGQLRLRQVDVLTAQDDSADELTDDQLLQRATELGRPLVTHDIRFKALAESWQAQGRPFWQRSLFKAVLQWRGDNDNMAHGLSVWHEWP